MDFRNSVNLEFRRKFVRRNNGITFKFGGLIKHLNAYPKVLEI